MPIGIPKLAGERPKKPKKPWGSLHDTIQIQDEGFNFLYFLSGPVVEKNANEVIGLMIYYALRQPDEDQVLFINCPGGYIRPGMALYDTMQAVPASVNTVCLGLAASLGCYILSGGAVNGRMAGAHARISIHHPMELGFLDDMSPSDYELAKDCYMLKECLRKVIIQDYAARTGKPESLIDLDMERDTFMTPMEAKDYGIIDLIL